VLLRQLEYLVALARERHFARAADACHVSQPSLSAGIRRLEGELGVLIVRRDRKFAGLTPEGERVLLWAHRILAECDGLRQDLDAMRGGVSGVLRLGAIPTALSAASLLSGPFCDRHRHARVSLESLPSREITDRLASYELDAALTYTDDSGAGTHLVPLYEERYLLLTPDGGPLAGRERVGWKEAAALPLCLLAPRMRNRRILDALFAEAGAAVVPAIETDTVSALYAHVSTRAWSSVVAHSWLHMFGVPEGMRVVRMDYGSRLPQIGLAVPGHRSESILVQALLEVARGVDVRGELERVMHRHLRRGADPG